MMGHSGPDQPESISQTATVDAGTKPVEGGFLLTSLMDSSMSFLICLVKYATCRAMPIVRAREPVSGIPNCCIGRLRGVAKPEDADDVQLEKTPRRLDFTGGEAPTIDILNRGDDLSASDIDGGRCTKTST